MTIEPYETWWNDPSEDEQRMEDSHAPHWKKIIDAILERDLTASSVLDFGCNQGGFLRLLYRERPFAYGLGVDLARRSVAIANERKGGFPIDYVVATTLAAYPGRFNLATSSAVIYLIDDLADHARQMRQALGAGGVYYATYTDYRGNPSLPAIRAEIDLYGAVPMQLHALDDIALAFQNEGFAVSARRLEVTEYVPLRLPDRFFQRVTDRMQYEYEQAYIFRFVAANT